jgi:Uma2 family endonuclease
METMVRTPTKTLLTAADLYELPDHGGRTELVKGELVPMLLAGAQDGKIVARLGGYLGKFVDDNGFGVAYAAGTGFTIEEEPDTVRAPDVSFVARNRIPPEGEPRGFWAIAPDLVAEVVSPFDIASKVQQKITEYLQAGVRLVWLIDPETQTVTVYKSLNEVYILLLEDVLTGEDVLPGFSLPLRQLFRQS